MLGISAIATAKNTAAGVVITIFRTLMISVFLSTLTQYGDLKNCSKYLYHGLAHGLARMPFFMAKFLKAMIAPYMGI